MRNESNSLSYIHYVLELQHAGLDVRLLLNDVELIRGTAEQAKTNQLKVNGWLIYGQNEIRLLAGLPVTPQQGKLLDLKCLLFRGAHGKQPEESEALARFAERDRSKLPQGEAQLVWQTGFAPNPFYGPWSWERGQQFALDEGVVHAAMDLVQRVVTYLNEQNADALKAIFRVMMEEMSRAYDLRLPLLAGQAQAWCEAWTPLQKFQPLPAEYSFTVEGNHRLLRVERKDGCRVFSLDRNLERPGPEKIYLAYLPTEGWIVVR